MKLSPLIKNISILPKYQYLHNYSRLNASSYVRTESVIASVRIRRVSKRIKRAEPLALIKVGKRNIQQSPWKMSFLVKLVRIKLFISMRCLFSC